MTRRLPKTHRQILARARDEARPAGVRVQIDMTGNGRHPILVLERPGAFVEIGIANTLRCGDQEIKRVMAHVRRAIEQIGAAP